MKEVGGQRLIDAYITAPSHLLHAAWKIGRSKLHLESGESLDVTVLSLRGADVAPIAIGMASCRCLQACQRGDAEDADTSP